MREKKVKPELEKKKTPVKKDLRNEIIEQINFDFKHKNQKQKTLTTSIKSKTLTFCAGAAGVGKTLVSVAEALRLLKTYPDIYNEIKLVKSVTQLEGEDIGTLPGEEQDKLKFIMMSFLDSFYKLIGEELTKKMLGCGLIKMEVFGSFRGRSLSNSIIIFDEFQNITETNAKTFLTRFGDDTKIIVLGDVNQVDLKNKSKSSFAPLIKMMKDKPNDDIGIIEFTEDEVVRHPLTKYFINLYGDETKNL